MYLKNTRNIFNQGDETPVQKRQYIISVVEEMKNFHCGNVSGALTMQNNREVPQKFKNLHNYNIIKQFHFWVFV